MKEKPTRRGFLGRLLAMPAVSLLPTGAEKWVAPMAPNPLPPMGNVTITISSPYTWSGTAYRSGGIYGSTSEDAWLATGGKKDK